MYKLLSGLILSIAFSHNILANTAKIIAQGSNDGRIVYQAICADGDRYRIVKFINQDANATIPVKKTCGYPIGNAAEDKSNSQICKEGNATPDELALELCR